MDALDTSVAVPALVARHVEHERCLVASGGAAVPAHALLETYSVLTRMPAPFRIDHHLARATLDQRFSGHRVLVPPVALQRSVVGRLSDACISGGAAYDGLVGLTAAHHGVTLLTRDRRAAKTYKALGVDFRFVG